MKMSLLCWCTPDTETTVIHVSRPSGLLVMVRAVLYAINGPLPRFDVRDAYKDPGLAA